MTLQRVSRIPGAIARRVCAFYIRRVVLLSSLSLNNQPATRTTAMAATTTVAAIDADGEAKLNTEAIPGMRITIATARQVSALIHQNIAFGRAKTAANVSLDERLTKMSTRFAITTLRNTSARAC